MTYKTIDINNFPRGELNKKIQLHIKGVNRLEGVSGPSLEGNGVVGEGYTWSVALEESVRYSNAATDNINFWPAARNYWGQWANSSNWNTFYYFVHYLNKAVEVPFKWHALYENKAVNSPRLPVISISDGVNEDGDTDVVLQTIIEEKKKWDDLGYTMDSLVKSSAIWNSSKVANYKKLVNAGVPEDFRKTMVDKGKDDVYLMMEEWKKEKFLREFKKSTQAENKTINLTDEEIIKKYWQEGYNGQQGWVAYKLEQASKDSQENQKPADLPTDWKEQLDALKKWTNAFPADEYPNGVEGIKNELKQLQSQVEDLRKQVEIQKKTITEQNINIVSLTSKLEKKDELISGQEAEIKALKAKIAELQQKVEKCMENHSKFQALQLDPGKQN